MQEVKQLIKRVFIKAYDKLHMPYNIIINECEKKETRVKIIKQMIIKRHIIQGHKG